MMLNGNCERRARELAETLGASPRMNGLAPTHTEVYQDRIGCWDGLVICGQEPDGPIEGTIQVLFTVGPIHVEIEIHRL